jgi:hypothetical protein
MDGNMDSKKEFDKEFKKIQENNLKNIDRIINGDPKGFVIDDELEDMYKLYEKVKNMSKKKDNKK